MNASNTSGMINALQNLDGTPYNPPEEVSSIFLKETGHKQLPRRRMLHNVQLTIVPHHQIVLYRHLLPRTNHNSHHPLNAILLRQKLKSLKRHGRVTHKKPTDRRHSVSKTMA